MEKFEQSKQERRESAKEFHFQEIMEIEPAMISLVSQLKKKIEKGEYDTLISDDVGGRIPTLILRKIIKELNPDQKLETYFIASGKTYFPALADKEKYRHVIDFKKQARVEKAVTEYIQNQLSFVAFQELPPLYKSPSL